LLDELRATLVEYVAFQDAHTSAAVALWIAATHALPAFEFAPRLSITSPQKRCAKSRLLDIIAGTCHHPLVSVNATVAAIFRSLGGTHPPTLLIDEADTLWGTKKAADQNEDLRALLNAGHQRGRPALRCVGPSLMPTEFPTFAMAALAGIGGMPDTITDRAVNVTMRRRAPGEQVAQFRSRRDGPKLEKLRDRLAEWAGWNLDHLTDSQPDMPVEDRAADTWEPLVAIADLVGGHWPRTARAACAALVSAATEADEDVSLPTRLLTDIRDIFEATNASFLPTLQLITELRRIEESPWGDFELTPTKLAHRLREFRIKPSRAERNTVRGYRLEDFSDVFRRYTRPHPSTRPQTANDQAEPVDGPEPVDGLTRPQRSARPQEITGQMAYVDTWTGEDGCGTNNAPTTRSDSHSQAVCTAMAVLNGRVVDSTDNKSDGGVQVSKDGMCKRCGKYRAISRDLCAACLGREEQDRKNGR